MKRVLLFLFLFGTARAEDKPVVNPASDLPAVPSPPPQSKGTPETINPAANLPQVSAPEPFELNDFSGGLNLRAPTTALAPNEALVCQNWLFSREGGLQVRPGFGRVNSSAIDLGSIWGLYHYSIPNYGKGFLVGDSIWIYKMAEDGTFADSQIYIDELQGDFTSGSNIVNIDFPTGFYNLERRICRGDKISFGSTEYEILHLWYDTALARYNLRLTTNASATVSNQAFRIRASNATVNKGSFIQRNNTVFFSMGGRQNARWNGKLGDIIGIYAQGKIDTVKFITAAPYRTDTSIVCNDCNFSTNELAGKILAFNTLITDITIDNPPAQFIQHRIISSNTAQRIFYDGVTLDSSLRIGQGQPFLIFNPVFTIVDSGTIDSVFQSVADYIEIRDNKNFYSPHLYRGKVIEFLDGAARGVLEVIDGGRLGSANGKFLIYNDDIRPQQLDSTNFPKKGDRYAIYSLGAQAALQEFYYGRLVLAGIPNFPNTIRPSETDNPDNYASADVLTLPEQGGDSIVFLSNTNGLLAVGQKHRLWVLVGPPPWTGQTVILASDGIGCVAPRSVVKDGKFIYFAGLRGNIPTIFRWQVEGATVNTAGGGTLFQGGGTLGPLTEKIDPLMMKVNRSKLDKISAGLFGEHLLVSLPFGTSAVNDSTIAINLRTGAIGLWTLAGGLWHNGRAAGDSGQVYFTAAGDTGWVYLFGGATDSLDLGQSFTTLYQSGWLDFGAPTLLKQGYRLWGRFFRSNGLGGAAWQVRNDFGTANNHTFTMSTTTGERDENSYMSVAALGKRFGFRFEGTGVRSSFLLKGLGMQFAIRGTAP